MRLVYSQKPRYHLCDGIVPPPLRGFSFYCVDHDAMVLMRFVHVRCETLRERLLIDTVRYAELLGLTVPHFRAHKVVCMCTGNATLGAIKFVSRLLRDRGSNTAGSQQNIAHTLMRVA